MLGPTCVRWSTSPCAHARRFLRCTFFPYRIPILLSSRCNCRIYSQERNSRNERERGKSSDVLRIRKQNEATQNRTPGTWISQSPLHQAHHCIGIFRAFQSTFPCYACHHNRRERGSTHPSPPIWILDIWTFPHGRVKRPAFGHLEDPFIPGE